MPSQPPIPPLLSPYLGVGPNTSLTLLTSTLGASANWLVLRFVHAALKYEKDGKVKVRGVEEEGKGKEGEYGKGDEETRVVLVSWLRDKLFWREGGRRVGIPPPNFHIVDALSTGLGLPTKTTAAAAGLEIVEKEILRAVDGARGGAGGEVEGGGGSGVGGAGGAAEEGREGRESRVVLVLDGLDFLLAATGATALQMGDLVGELRSHVHSLILTSCADLPLMQQQSPSPTTPLEIEHAAFVTGMAHLARSVLSVRELDTGGARDVSGVLRVSRGGAWEEGEGEFEEREVLFFVGGDGGVRVFERGGGG